MEKSKIRIFLYVVDSGSLTKAAAAFGYTTSGISHMMAALEEEVGFPLLVRSKSGVVPTDNASRLIPIMRSQVSWDEQLQQTISEISGMNSGSITGGKAEIEEEKEENSDEKIKEAFLIQPLF